MIVSVAVNGGNTSSVSKKPPIQVDYRPVICNVVKDSHSSEAIKSLEATLVATLEKKFEQLMIAMNKTFSGSSGKAFTMLFYLCPYLAFYHHFVLFVCIFGQVSHLLRVRIFTKITSKL